jgi:predicted ATPase
MLLLPREPEAEALRRALERHRLVTVWGPSGVGKSCLVRQVLGDRAVSCSLGAAREGPEVLRALADALGLSPTAEARATAVVRALGHKDRNVILDGADRATQWLRQWLPKWLDACAAVRFVVTAQSRLGVEGEHSLELSPPATEDAATRAILPRRARSWSASTGSRSRSHGGHHVRRCSVTRLVSTGSAASPTETTR